jgi:hypothetical protein
MPHGSAAEKYLTSSNQTNAADTSETPDALKEGLNKLIKASGFGIGPSPIAKNTEIGHIPPI